jgi:hypothetical protein
MHVVFYGDKDVFINRLNKRESKNEVPFEYKTLTMKGLIKTCDYKLPQEYPTAYFIQTDTDEKEEQYRTFEEQVLVKKKEIEQYLRSFNR